MEPLGPPETHYLSAAIGWLELGRPADARAELDALSPAAQNHPDVLEVRWLLNADQEQWDRALATARALIHVAPQRPSGWLHQAYALRRVPDGGLQKAWEALLPVADRFPKEATIPFNLSCYACQMRQLEVARVWLKRALTVGGKERIKQMALADPDLEALWAEIKQY